MTIITAVNGNRYKSYLMALLDSLAHVGIDKVLIVYNDIDNIHELQKIFPHISLIKYNANGVNDRINKITSKVEYWHEALKNCDDDQVVFVDGDTYFLKNPQEVFNIAHMLGEPFDIAYTVREGKWRINTGVIMFIVNKRLFSIFLDRWGAKNKLILRNKDLIKNSAVRYGAIDQMGFTQTVNEFENCTKFKEILCSKWNMCDCTNELDDVGILHLKGCLPLLLKERLYGKEYGDERQPEICEKMFNLWRKSYKDVLGKLKENQ